MKREKEFMNPTYVYWRMPFEGHIAFGIKDAISRRYLHASS